MGDYKINLDCIIYNDYILKPTFQKIIRISSLLGYTVAIKAIYRFRLLVEPFFISRHLQWFHPIRNPIADQRAYHTRFIDEHLLQTLPNKYLIPTKNLNYPLFALPIYVTLRLWLPIHCRCCTARKYLWPPRHPFNVRPNSIFSIILSRIQMCSARTIRQPRQMRTWNILKIIWANDTSTFACFWLIHPPTQHVI